MSSSIRAIFTNVVSRFRSLFSKPTKDDIAGFVIDTSICGIDNPLALLEELTKSIDGTNRKIILTNVTIDELDSLQKRSNQNSKIARAILTAATNDRKHYKPIEIDTSFELADDCILNFCKEHKDTVILLTADKGMHLKAVAMSIETHYYQSLAQPKEYKKSSIKTLYPTTRDCEKLLLATTFNPISTAFRVCSRGIEYNITEANGPHELHVGDDVLIAKNKGNYISLTHFRIISLYDSDNCELVYTKRIYSSQDVVQLDAFYKSFIKDFKHSRHIK